MGTEGGQKSGHPWLVLSAWATAEPGFFQGYIHNPRAKNVHADMPAFPDYDAATLPGVDRVFQHLHFPGGGKSRTSGGQEKTMILRVAKRVWFLAWHSCTRWWF